MKHESTPKEETTENTPIVGEASGSPVVEEIFTEEENIEEELPKEIEFTKEEQEVLNPALEALKKQIERMNSPAVKFQSITQASICIASGMLSNNATPNATEIIANQAIEVAARIFSKTGHSELVKEYYNWVNENPNL